MNTVALNNTNSNFALITMQVNENDDGQGLYF